MTKAKNMTILLILSSSLKKKRSIAMSRNVKNSDNFLNDKTLLVTADIGKYLNYCYARTPKGEELEPFEFHNTGSGFMMVSGIIEIFRKKHHLDRILFGIESTGNYGEPLIHYMVNRGIQMVQVNPLHTKKVKEMRGNSPNKNDKKDPKVIADIIALRNSLTVVIPRGASADLDRMIHLREILLEDKKRAYNQLESAIVPIFPEFLHVFKDLQIKTVEHLLKNYPLPESIVKLGLEDLKKTLYTVSRGHFGRKKSDIFYEAALSSAGIKEGIEGTLLIIKNLYDKINLLDRQLSQVEESIGIKLSEVPYSRFIMSIKGVGPMITAAIIGEVGDLRKYDCARQLQKLAGINLYEISSGKQIGQRHITKRGRHLLRKMLYYAALNVTKKGGILHDTYNKHLKKGMRKTQALMAISRKIICIIYALVRDSSDYIERVDKSKIAA
jgi:transposase